MTVEEKIKKIQECTSKGHDFWWGNGWQVSYCYNNVNGLECWNIDKFQSFEDCEKHFFKNARDNGCEEEWFNKVRIKEICINFEGILYSKEKLEKNRRKGFTIHKTEAKLFKTRYKVG